VLPLGATGLHRKAGVALESDQLSDDVVLRVTVLAVEPASEEEESKSVCLGTCTKGTHQSSKQRTRANGGVELKVG
jgi:hypothetical protein